MMRIRQYRGAFLSACLAVLLLVTCASSFAQEESDEGLKKKYAPILGEYEFVLGGEALILRFYIEGSTLWADSGDGRPATLKPVEDAKFSFTAEDPISGSFEIEFIEDDQGEYNVCRLVIVSRGIEIEGIKIK